MTVMARRERYQMKSAPASRPATTAAAMMAPVSPNAATATSIMLSSLVACAGPAEDAPEPLDESAKLACAPFEELASKYDSLDEDQRAVLAWEVWNNAQFSETTGIRRIGRLVLDVIIENKASVVEITGMPLAAA